MNIKRFLLIVMIAGIAIGLLACERPASTGLTTPKANTTGTKSPAVGTESSQTMGDIGTQTAVAKDAAEGQTEPTSVPEVQPAVTETPQPPAPEPTKPAVSVPAATLGRPSTYTLQKGEFPYCLARRFDVNPSDLLSMNGLSASSKTVPGQSLKIPQTGNWPGTRALKSHPAEYTVKAGDTVYSVACLYGDVDPLVIAQVNGLSEPYTLEAGKKLQIP